MSCLIALEHWEGIPALATNDAQSNRQCQALDVSLAPMQRRNQRREQCTGPPKVYTVQDLPGFFAGSHACVAPIRTVAKSTVLHRDAYSKPRPGKAQRPVHSAKHNRP